MIGGIEETSASFEARSAPRSYPTKLACYARPQRSMLARVDVDAFEVGEMELALRALLEKIEPGFAFLAIAERLGHELRVDADEVIHVAPQSLNTLDAKSKMVDLR